MRFASGLPSDYPDPELVAVAEEMHYRGMVHGLSHEQYEAEPTALVQWALDLERMRD